MTTTAGRDHRAAVRCEVRTHPRCELHRPPPGHPEAPSRLRSVVEALERRRPAGFSIAAEAPLPPEEDVVGVLAWLHSRDHIDRVRTLARSGGGRLDSDDCLVSPGTWEAAIAAAGLALQCGLDVANRRLERAFLALRPPSHHAERDRARGYCFFNATALLAEVVSRAWGAPVLIVDIDAHHGNGTQQLFWERGDVGYVSVHEFPAFPGSGSADEIGEGKGLGMTRNVPLSAGSGDQEVASALTAAVDEVGSRLQPALVVVSAGFSGHHRDPVSQLRMTTEGFARLTRIVVQAAEVWAGGRIVSLLEGGYQPTALVDGVLAHVAELARGEDGQVM